MVDIDLPTYIPLEEASERYDIPLEILQQAVENNLIRALVSMAESEESVVELAVAEDDVAAMKKHSPKALPAFISFEKAATKYNISVDVLIEAVNKGAIQAARVGDVMKLAESDVVIIAIQLQKQQEDDELVSINEASRRLGVHSSVVSSWHRYGWLPTITSGTRGAKLVSWKQAQALGRLYHERTRQGSRLIPKSRELPELQIQ